jgi:hypothetical protein
MSRMSQALRRIEAKTPPTPVLQPSDLTAGVAVACAPGILEPLDFEDATIAGDNQIIADENRFAAGDVWSFAKDTHGGADDAWAAIEDARPMSEVVCNYDRDVPAVAEIAPPESAMEPPPAELAQDPTQASEAAADAVEQLAKDILAALPAHAPATLLFTSPDDAIGQTKMLSSLSKSLAASGNRKVAVVDGGLQDPEIQLRDLRRDFDLALIDAASLQTGEALSLAPHCDGVYLVVRLLRTSRRVLKDAVKVLQADGAKLLGCVVIEA